MLFAKNSKEPLNNISLCAEIQGEEYRFLWSVQIFLSYYSMQNVACLRSAGFPPPFYKKLRTLWPKSDCDTQSQQLQG